MQEPAFLHSEATQIATQAKKGQGQQSVFTKSTASNDCARRLAALAEADLKCLAQSNDCCRSAEPDFLFTQI